MEIRAVIENTSTCGLQTEHGLSLWIEACGRKFFFDLGQGDLFVENSQKMEIDPSKAEFAIISHGHYDHGGGIGKFLEINHEAPVYISKHAFIDCYAWKGDGAHYIGLNKSVKPGGRIVPTDGITHLDKGLILIDQCLGREFFSPANRSILKSYEENELNYNPEDPFEELKYAHFLTDAKTSEPLILIEDDFWHEQSLVIVEGDKRVLIGGCAHSGIINIMEKAEKVVGAPMTHVITGLHLKGVDDMEFIDSLAEALLKRGCKYYTCHCTGEVAYQRLKERMGDKIDYFSCGQTLTI